MVDVNVPSQAAFLSNGEIIKMHTIHERNYRVKEEPRNGNSKANKKLPKNNLLLQMLSSTATEMDAVHDLLTDHLFLENAGRRTFSTFFEKDRFLHLRLSILRMPLHINMLWKRVARISYGWCRNDCESISCFYPKFTQTLFWKFQLPPCRNECKKVNIGQYVTTVMT